MHSALILSRSTDRHRRRCWQQIVSFAACAGELQGRNLLLPHAGRVVSMSLSFGWNFCVSYEAKQMQHEGHNIDT
jgi:hypothetical protein